ncbi:monovalent cation/H(+) antiporter subunit G [Bauldia sp.]|uniref:monovalent cation/H(+) antiporter subunit G n=1 Tax=Bauldia sp. TaxID=2575872 RepID=UPI003BAB2A43
MTGDIVTLIGGIVTLAGALLMAIGALGIVRMPDIFTRMHAASVTDTLGVSLVLIGLVFFSGWSLVSVKLIFLVLFIALTSPTATHAVARAALHAGFKPRDKTGREIEDVDPPVEEATSSKP